VHVSCFVGLLVYSFIHNDDAKRARNSVVRDFVKKFELKEFNRFPKDSFFGVYKSIVRVFDNLDLYVSIEVSFLPRHSSVKFQFSDHKEEFEFPDQLEDHVTLRDFQALPRFGSDLFGATLKIGERRKVAIFSKKVDFYQGSGQKLVYPTLQHQEFHLIQETENHQHFLPGRYRALVEGPNEGIFLDVTFEFFAHKPDVFLSRVFFIDRCKDGVIYRDTDLAAFSFKNLKMVSSHCVFADVTYGDQCFAFAKLVKISASEDDFQPGEDDDARCKVSRHPVLPAYFLEVPPDSELMKPMPGTYATVGKLTEEDDDVAFGMGLTLYPDSEILSLRYSDDLLNKKIAFDANLLFTVEGGWMVVKDDMSKRLMPEKMISFKSLTFGKDWISGVFKINGKNRLLMLSKVNEENAA